MKKERLILFILFCLIYSLGVSAEFELSQNVPVNAIRNLEIQYLPNPIDETNDTLLYHWNFTTPSGWTFYDASNLPPYWHPDTVPGRGNDSAWWCGTREFRGYGNYWNQVVQTPMLDLSATTNPILACKLWVSVENGNYDGVTLWISTNGGNSFSVINNVNPPYNANNLNAASSLVWNYGNNIPGYSGETYGYRVVTANLVNFRQDSVIVRWTLLSDRAISSETRDTMRGAYLDSIRISDGANLLFVDDGNQMNANSLQPIPTWGFGVYWTWSNAQYVSAPTAANCDDDMPNQASCLVSPPIQLPNMATYFRFQVRCDMPDSTHAGSNYLRDYYRVELMGPDSVWRWVISDYSRGGYGYPNWYDYGPGSPYNGNLQLNLSAYAGQTIRLRWKAITDYDNNPSGTGLWIDDVRIYGTDAPLYQLMPLELRIPFPTTLGRDLTQTPFVRIKNIGAGNLTNLQWALRLDNEQFIQQPPIPLLQADSIRSYSFNLELDTVRSFYPAVRFILPNDSVVFQEYDEVIIRSPNYYELGYDTRHFWIGDTMPSGRSIAVRFQPSSENFLGNFNVVQARFATMGDQSGAVHLKIMSASGARPGSTLLDTIVVCTPGNPNRAKWYEFNVEGRPEGMNRSGVIWVVLDRVAGQPLPLFACDTITYGIQKTYTWLGGTSTPSQHNRDVAVRLVIQWPYNDVNSNVENILPNTFQISTYPNPMNSITNCVLTLPKSDEVNMNVYSIDGRKVDQLFKGKLHAGKHTFQWNAFKQTSGMYFIVATNSHEMRVSKLILLK
ncbi:MAG: T9SS type A sorting domain-containing protein [bacterium]|nr:T9SS type A sorting domain-containing protein [bacterium]